MLGLDSHRQDSGAEMAKRRERLYKAVVEGIRLSLPALRTVGETFPFKTSCTDCIFRVRSDNRPATAKVGL